MTCEGCGDRKTMLAILSDTKLVEPKEASDFKAGLMRGRLIRHPRESDQLAKLNNQPYRSWSFSRSVSGRTGVESKFDKKTG